MIVFLVFGETVLVENSVFFRWNRPFDEEHFGKLLRTIGLL